MEFKASPVAQAEGGILAHSVRTNGLNLRKGRVLSRGDLEALGRAGVESVVIARLNNEDLGENEAAARIAAAAAGDHVRVGAAFTGRANLYAREHGLALVDAALVDRINLIHESITLAYTERKSVSYVTSRPLFSSVGLSGAMCRFGAVP